MSTYDLYLIGKVWFSDANIQLKLTCFLELRLPRSGPAPKDKFDGKLLKLWLAEDEELEDFLSLLLFSSDLDRFWRSPSPASFGPVLTNQQFRGGHDSHSSVFYNVIVKLNSNPKKIQFFFWSCCHRWPNLYPSNRHINPGGKEHVRFFLIQK